MLLICCAVLTLLDTGAKAHPDSTEVDSSAKSAILIERNTGAVLYSHNADQPLPMASTTKVMTALLALEYGNLDEIVTVGLNAYGVPGTSIYLSEGEKITLRDLLYGLMLASGNDAAVAIAEHISGDVDTFCRKMTHRAAELGCTDTVFLSPNGLPTNGHHTTARDLALIAREAMKYDFFRQLVSTRRASIPWEGRSYHRILNNKNKLLTDYEGATGIKTGYTKAAGRCLVFGAKRGNLEVIGVVLNCPDWFNEAARLMDMGFANYDYFAALSCGESVRMLPVSDGVKETVSLCAAEDLGALIPKGHIPSLEYDMPDSIPAGFVAGDVAGEARIVLGGRVLATCPLVYSEGISQRDYSFDLQRILQLWQNQPEEIPQ